jgi:hypothetical protein
MTSLIALYIAPILPYIMIRLLPLYFSCVVASYIDHNDRPLCGSFVISVMSSLVALCMAPTVDY